VKGVFRAWGGQREKSLSRFSKKKDYTFQNPPERSLEKMKSALALVLLAATTTSIGCGGGAASFQTPKSPVVTAPPPAPTASLSANPGTISKGESTTLTWQTSNATDVSIDGVGVQLNGSESVTPADSTTYTLTAKGAGGTQTATAMVTVTTPPPPPVVVPKHYLIVDLIPIPGANNAQANAISGGHSAGYSVIEGGTARATLWQPDGTPEDLGNGYANAINSSQVVAGYVPQPDATSHATIWDHGVVSDLLTINGYDSSIATGINDAGTVVGFAFSSKDPTHQIGFRWTASIGIQSIPGSATVSGINASGDIAGTNLALHAAIFAATGTTIDLGTLGDFSLALAVNDSRHAVGYSPTQSGGPVHAFFYNGVLQDLGTLQVGSDTTAVAVNNADIVVGDSNLAGHSLPFVWSATTGMIDLNTLISPDSGWVLATASSVDQEGRIVGAGGVNGVVHGFVLTPDWKVLLLQLSELVGSL
jgi:probable HAF family extracellular repeat protein